jgi:dihydroorotate dehydrogenase (NAD+) catalytic subunit
VKAKRRVAPGERSRRTPTVRRIKPAIAPVPRPPASAGGVVPAERSGSRPPPTGATVPAAPTFEPAYDAAGSRPVELAVDLGRGLVLANPIVAAAGPYGYGVEVADQLDLAGLGALVTRGTTLRARAGHGAPRAADIPGGLLWGVGLQNPGVEVVLERYAPTWAGWPVPVIVNLGGSSVAELVDLARRLDGAPGVAGLELNLSCPNGPRGMAFGLDAGAAGSLVAAVRRATDLPLLAKLSPAAVDVREIAAAVEDAGADAISAVNTLPGLAVAGDRSGAALGAGYGGVCGPALRPVALRVVFEIAQVVSVPIVGIGGVATLADVLDMLAVGATAVGVGVAGLADPMLPVRLADELADACRALGVTRASDLVGTALPGRPSEPSTRGAEFAG